MATLRSHARIRRSADDVWAVVSAPARISEWFPGTVDAHFDDGTRSITLRSGVVLTEDVVTVDHHLRRFQYRLTGPMPVAHHLGTIDVLDDDPGCLLVYSTEIRPEPMAFVFDGAISAATAELTRLMEQHALDVTPDHARTRA